MSRGIDAAAVYLPRYRLTADEVAEAWGQADMPGIERKTVAAADEDAITMAVTAGERLLEDRSGRDEIDLVAAATTSPPLAEDALRGRIVRALGVDVTCESLLLTGDTAVFGAALSRALDAEGTALVLVADDPDGDPGSSDHRLGAGAAAFLITDGATVPIVARGSHTDERSGVRYRSDKDDAVDAVGITQYERTAVKSALSGAFEACGDQREWEDVSGVSIHQPDGGLPYRMTGALPVDQEAIHAGMVVGEIGDTGAATVPIGLCKLLAERDGQIGVCVFGGGSAQAFQLEGSVSHIAGLDELDRGEEVTYARYLRLRGHLGRGEVAGGGANVSLPNWQASIPQRYRLIGGTCDACGGLNFPPDGACQHCHERAGYTDRPLSFEGTIAATTVIGQGGAPPEFAEQQHRSGEYVAAIVSLSGGDQSVRVPAQIVDCDPSSIDVGDRVVARFRRIYTQEGIVRYGRKFAPLR